MRNARKSSSRFVLPLICAAAVLACGLCWSLIALRRSEKDNGFDEERISALESSLESERENSARLSSELDALSSDHLGALDELEKAGISAGIAENEYSIKLEELMRELEESKIEIQRLGEDIAELEKISAVDINAQFDVLRRLEAKLAERPIRIKVTETEEADGSITRTEEELEANIALAYYDLDGGYSYTYNGDAPLNPASMIKAPYVLAQLIAASEEEDKISALREECEKNGTPFTEPKRKYDMSRTITYTRDEYYAEGSGEIAESRDGTEYTYLDLFYHTLECSDNVAYNIIHNEYGKTAYTNLLRRLGTSSLLQGKLEMSACDAVKVMREIYSFTESDAEYASFMKKAMIESRHLVIIPFAVKPASCAHKYGWDIDSYCDMAIVYDRHPYIVVVMTDYDGGEDEINAYLRGLVGLISELHANFHVENDE